MKEYMIELFIDFYVEVLRPILFSIFFDAIFSFCYLYFFARYMPSPIHMIMGLICGLAGISCAIFLNEMIKLKQESC